MQQKRNAIAIVMKTQIKHCAPGKNALDIRVCKDILLVVHRLFRLWRNLHKQTQQILLCEKPLFIYCASLSDLPQVLLHPSGGYARQAGVGRISRLIATSG